MEEEFKVTFKLIFALNELSKTAKTNERKKELTELRNQLVKKNNINLTKRK